LTPAYAAGTLVRPMGSLVRQCGATLAVASVMVLSVAGSAQAVGFEPIPLSVAADGAGHVYVSSPLTSHAVQQYSSDGALLANLGEFPTSSNPFFPRGIATDAAGALYVDDGTGETISVLGADGSVLRHWSARQGRDLAVGADGSVYMAGPREILRFSADGALLSKWEGPGGNRQFGEVWGIDTSPSGLVYVADTYGNSIEVFTADGAFVTEWGRYGKGDGQFIYPYGIAVSAAGEVYVADTVNARVERFGANGEFLGAWGGPGRAPGRFYTPTGVATDPAGNVYVVDMAEPYPGEGHVRVQKFTADGQFVTQWYDGPPPPPGPPRLSSSVGRRTTKRTATFHFHSRQGGVAYSCRLSGEWVPPRLREWRTCTSPKRYARLRPGRKVFHVRAIEEGVSSYEARHGWVVLARRPG
jgi:6-bladed beta-propeller protein